MNLEYNHNHNLFDVFHTHTHTHVSLFWAPTFASKWTFDLYIWTYIMTTMFVFLICTYYLSVFDDVQSDSWWEGNPSAKNKKCLIPYSTRIWGIRARLRSASKVIGTRRNICEDLLPDFRFRMFSNRSRIPSNTSWSSFYLWARNHTWSIWKDWRFCWCSWNGASEWGWESNGWSINSNGGAQRIWSTIIPLEEEPLAESTSKVRQLSLLIQRLLPFN